MISKNQLAVAIRTMSQDLEAVKKGAKPTARLEPFAPNPPETLPVEPLGLKARPSPLSAPATAPTQLRPVTRPMPVADGATPAPSRPTPPPRPTWLPPEPPSRPTAPPMSPVVQGKTPTPEVPRPAPRPAGPLTDPVRPAFSQTPKPPPPPRPLSRPADALAPTDVPRPALPHPAPPIPPEVATPKPPQTKADHRQRVVAIILTAALVLAGGGGALWWFWIKPAPSTPPVGEQPQPPQPPPIIAPTPLLPGLTVQNVEVATVTDIPQGVDGLLGSLAAGASNQVLLVKIKGVDAARYAAATDIIDGYGLRIPEQIRPDITDLNLVWHGQSEILSAQPIPERSRFGLVAKLRSIAGAPASLRAWEQTISADLDRYLRIERFGPAAEQPAWHDSDYRGIQIRYANFPLADQSIDYVILSGENLLLIATSREGMYGLIDAALAYRPQ